MFDKYSLLIFGLLGVLVSCDNEPNQMIIDDIGIRLLNNTSNKLTSPCMTTFIQAEKSPANESIQTKCYDDLNVAGLSAYRIYDSFNSECQAVQSDEYEYFIIDCIDYQYLENGRYTMTLFDEPRLNIITKEQ